MVYLVIALFLAGAVTALLTWFSSRGKEESPVLQPTNSCATCDGKDKRCEQECMLDAATKEIEYYDDEELDRFQGRPSDGYTDTEVEQFAEVLYTMRPEEVSGWNRSLLLRGINIPDQLKDELAMMIDNEV